MEEIPDKVADIWRNPDGTFKTGHTGLGGRPKGKTLKEYAREYLANLPDELKTKYLASLPGDIVWKMAEGLPQQDITSGGDKIIPTPLLDGLYNNKRNTEDSKPEEEDKSDTGRNVGG